MMQLRRQLEAVFARLSPAASSSAALEADLLLIAAVVALEGPHMLHCQGPLPPSHTLACVYTAHRQHP